jgi:EAL domain-containing protein (putative c-di-GMP-specific phosphodiesterase class I)
MDAITPGAAAGLLAGDAARFGKDDVRQAWEHALSHHRSAGSGRDDFLLMMNEVDFLLQKRYPLGIAVMIGSLDREVLRQVESVAKGLADYVAWTVVGPIVVAAFGRGLFDEWKRVWRPVVAHGVDVACGVAFSNDFGRHDELLLAARIALYRAIARRTDILVLDGEAAASAVTDHGLACRLEEDIAAGGRNLVAHFQPQVSLASDRPAGAEALARWRQDGVDVQPSYFIPIAEEAGLMEPLGRIMIGHAARAIKSLRLAGMDVPQIAVNLSPRQGSKGDFLRSTLDIMRSERLTPADLEFEISESHANDGDGDFLRWLDDLSAAGFPLAIDHFGENTSKLARVHELPARTVKLDRGRVAALPRDTDAHTLCRVAIDLIHAHGRRSLAEGIERPEQAACLQSLDCKLGQGYYWARPMPEAELIAWWSTRN